MTIKSIRIKEGLFERTVEFSENVNLIYSQYNSKGKTTLLRLLLYSMGYSIPSTKNIKFERCEVETCLVTEKVGHVRLSRFGSGYLVADIGDESNTYVLPEQQKELQGILFGTQNDDILSNILGTFYLDQEKGWTLLNRGVVIGSIHFDIGELVRGLSGRSCEDLINQEAKLSRELGKYKQMFNVAKYRETIESEIGSLAVDHYEERYDSSLEQLLIQQSILKKELNRVDKAISDNKKFKKFISEMKLLIKGPDGVSIPVTSENILGFDDSVAYLIAKRKIITAELSKVLDEYTELKRKKSYEEEQLSFWTSETLIQSFDRRIASINIDPVSIKKEMDRIEKMLKEVRKEINTSTKRNNEVVNSLHQNVIRYLDILGVDNASIVATSYIFTTNLKELSGAILHKTVFAFRLAYIFEVEKALGIKLPIILDSPSGKEVDQENIGKMMDILKSDFSDHQIIIASIFKYDFNHANVIEIVNRLIETQ